MNLKRANIGDILLKGLNPDLMNAINLWFYFKKMKEIYVHIKETI